MAPRIQEIAARLRIPRATYRMQLTRDFTLRDAAELADYLSALGISDLYASPILQARPGSTHGYDICDHSHINPELGGEEGLDLLSNALCANGLGLLVDTVPNHMSIGADCNGWWADVLENGPSSPYARYFDISWHPVKPELENKVLLPILGEPYGRALDGGALQLAYDNGSFFIRYRSSILPLAPRTYRLVLEPVLEKLNQQLSADDAQRQELESILTALNYLPPRTEQDPARLAERHRERQVIKRRLATLTADGPVVRAALDRTIQELNGTPENPHSFDRLDELLAAQPYRAAFWRVAAEEINYRRFFDIDDMAAVRVELPEVFEATHQLLLRLAVEGKITGLRVDHPDGLWNPTDYFRQLQSDYLSRALQTQSAEPAACAAAQAWVDEALERATRDRAEGQAAESQCGFPLYTVAEKILMEGEPLPPSWAVFGTTGYDFCSSLDSILIDGDNEKALTKIYAHFTGRSSSYPEIVRAAKETVMLSSLASEMNSLSHQLERLAEKNRRYRDLTLNGLRLAIRQVIAALSVYRTYVDAPRGFISPADDAYITAAVDQARRRNPQMPAELYEFLGDTLRLRNFSDRSDADRAEAEAFVMRFQQLTGPVMAKGVEDTAFYRYNRLVSLNEVGGNPARFGQTVAGFHRANGERRRAWRHSMLASSTHDTKRGEDVRARIDVLSELPDEWKKALARWRRWNAPKKIKADGEPAPDANDEYLLYQTLLGAWIVHPTAEQYAGLRDRIAAYMAKATKEAKVHTNWINPNQAYDDAVQAFVKRILPESGASPFLTSLAAFAERVAFFGRINSLAQTVLKLTVPGVPDFYQGTELYDFSLVDPDNRRPVDYSARRANLQELQAQLQSANSERAIFARELVEKDLEGKSKLYLIYQTLHYRQAHAALFDDGTYVPLEVRGEEQDHICAFARRLQDRIILVAVPRLDVGLMRGVEQLPLGEAVWKDTWLTLPSELAAFDYQNLYTGSQLTPGPNADGIAGIPVRDLLRDFPVAVLHGSS